jgi:uncharacterized protein (TIGR00297 family)
VVARETLILLRAKNLVATFGLLLAGAPDITHTFALLKMQAVRGRVSAAILVTVLFAAIAHRVRAVDVAGAVAGAFVSFLLYLTYGPAGFALLVTVFLLAWGSTRLGHARKQRLGISERKQGRNAGQILSNLVVAGALAVAALFVDPQVLTLAMVGALAEAAADTVSGECGQAATDQVYLITTFQRVPVGTDGGISLIGTLAGIAAAVLVGFVAAVTKLIPLHWVAAIAGAAILGGCIDSILGATLQRRGWMNNNAVNLASTITAAGLVLLFLL